jgi:two-component system chemotaxis response regulator CheY
LFFAAPVSSPPTSQPQRKSVLFVDDDEDMRVAIYEMFSARYQVTLAVDGLDGYTKATGEPRPDLIITDVAMPQLDGVAMAGRIRENEAMRNVPIIFLTGQMSPASLLAGLTIGRPFAYLCKTTAAYALAGNVERALCQT